MVRPVILDVALDLLRHFFFLDGTDRLAGRASQKVPWQQITMILQKAFPDSQLEQLSIVRATNAVTERKKTVVRSTGVKTARDELKLRHRTFFPPLEFARVPANKCVTDGMLKEFLKSLLPPLGAPPPEIRPSVVRSPITTIYITN